MTRSGPNPIDLKGHQPVFVECGCCGYWHPSWVVTDCRADNYRFTTEELDRIYPDQDGDGWPDWTEEQTITMSGDEWMAQNPDVALPKKDESGS